jgi:competence protein ComEC
LPVQTAPNALFAALRRAPAALETALDAALAAEADQLPLWIPVLFGIGIAASLALPWHADRVAAAAAMAACIAIGLALRGGARQVLVAAGITMLIGFGVAATRTQRVAAPRLAQPGFAQLVGVITAAEDRSASGEIRLHVAPFDPALPPRVRIGVPQAGMAAVLRAALIPGARISAPTRLAPPQGPMLPGGQDFARQTWFDGIGATGTALGPVSLLAPAPPPSALAARLAAARAALTALLYARLPGTPGSFAAALVTGERGAIPKPVVAAMRDAGLAHLLSISGLHIAIVAAGTLWTTRKLLLLWPWLALRVPVQAIGAAAAAGAAIAYTLLAGSEIPMVRACLATVIVLAGVMLGREALTLRMIAAAALVILLFRPEALFDPSFQLSFAAVTGLVALYQSRLGRWLNTRPVHDGWARRLARLALALIVTGLIAEAMLSATALYHFNRTGLYGAIANLLAIPLTSFVIMPLQIAALAFDRLGIAAPLWWLLGHAYGLLIGWAEWVARWPGGVLRLPTMPPTAYALLIGGGLWLCLWNGSVRRWAVLPLTVGAVLALTARPPDIWVSADGRQIGLRADSATLLTLRAPPQGFAATRWRTASATDADIALAAYAGARCNRWGCRVTIGSGADAAQLWLTLARTLPDRAALTSTCAGADIVISNLALPDWCTPRRLRIDRTSLAQTQALAIWLSPLRVHSVADQIGDHPWLPVAPTARRRGG